jgi:hypothetical protein
MVERSFVRSPNALSRNVGGELLLASTDGERIDSLSETAAAVWALLETPRTIGALIEVLAERYAVPRDTIATDVETLVEALVARGWAEERPGVGAV